MTMSNDVKVHVSLNVKDLDESVAFYRAMFGVDPVKLKPGYAKFDISEPALNLALNQAGEVQQPGALNHLGVQVNSTEAVLEAKGRLSAAGLATFDEMNTDCCYALQEKIWVTDPNGYRWEVFVVKIGDTAPELNVSPSSETDAQAAQSFGAPCCGTQRGER
ncbi:MAG TPA: ArsI/CadI family heavy metal resistance metalloenzyme [Blastocatellia bacterium]|nr:ArsI/CadI family heavy metal resistance metalloenzyme [Blastocatellia bacterium]